MTNKRRGSRCNCGPILCYSVLVYIPPNREQCRHRLPDAGSSWRTWPITCSAEAARPAALRPDTLYYNTTVTLSQLLTPTPGEETTHRRGSLSPEAGPLIPRRARPSQWDGRALTAHMWAVLAAPRTLVVRQSAGSGRYRGTSLTRNRHSVTPYSRTMPRVLGGS